jgi:hypothetical protein
VQVFALGLWVNPWMQDSHLLASAPVHVLQFGAQSRQTVAELPARLNFPSSQRTQVAGAVADSFWSTSLQVRHREASLASLQFLQLAWHCAEQLPEV